VAGVAQCFNHAANGAIGKLPWVEGRAIDKILLNQIPDLPKGGELRGLICGLHNAWAEQIRVPADEAGTKGTAG
jgi:hypothetical protein